MSAPPKGTSWAARQREHYDEHHRAYDDERAGRGRAYERKAALLRAVLPPGAQRVLEVGSGSGLLTARLLPTLACVRYDAVDLSASMTELHRARSNDPRLVVSVADAAALPFEDEAFDVVLGVDILHHVEDPVAVLAEWRRATRPGGTLAVLESNGYHPANLAHVGDLHELRVFLNSDANLARWASEAGWSGARAEPTPAYTPSGPAALARALDAVDWLAYRLPGARRLTALWRLLGRRE